MRLSRRIYLIADCVSAGETAADIGTDHGYVPMILVKNNISPRVIMSDISEGSLSKAVDTFSLCGLSVPEDSYRIGDGLDTIGNAEVDDVIIAGLGGLTIINILESDIAKSRSFSKLILQPRKFSGDLRYFLYTRGWDIIREGLAPEGKFVCEVIVAVPSDAESREAPYSRDDIRWKYPPSITEADPGLARRRIRWKIGSIEEEIRNLSLSRSDKSELIGKLEQDKQYLINLISSHNHY